MRAISGAAAGALAALAAAALAACVAPPPPPADYVVVGIESAPISLDPRSAVDATSAQVTSLTHRGLTAVAPGGEVVPDLAEQWETPDPLTWRFHLGPARFHDGSPVGADDVVATYRSLAAPAFRGLHREGMEPLDTVEAEDDRTVRFALRRPYAAFPYATTIGVVPASCAGRAECTLGSGPFRLAARSTDTVTLAAAETAEPPPLLPGIVFRASPDGASRALGLARASVDLVQNGVEPELVPWLRERGLEVIETPASTFQYLGFNLRVPALADARVRRAIAHALDVRAIVDHLLAGQARPASELFPPEHWAHAGVAPLAHDPDLARSLLAEAGALPLRLEVKTSTVALRRRIAEAIAFALGRVGIEVVIRPLEWAALYGDVRRGNFELVSLAWVGVNDPDLYFSWLHSAMTPPRGNNRGGYASPTVDRLTVAGREAAAREERRALYRAMAEELARDLPFVPLWWPSNVVVKTRLLEGFAPTPGGDLRGLARARWTAGAPDRRGS